MIFFKRTYAAPSSLQIEDYIPVSEFESLLPKHQKFLKKLFSKPSPHLEKFVSKLSTNGITISREILEKMIEQLYLESQIPLTAFSLDTIKNMHLPDLQHQNNPNYHFWIEILQKLKIWERAFIPEHVMFSFFRIIDQMLTTGYHPEFQSSSASKTFWKNELSFPELTAFKFLYEKFKYFHSEEVIQAKRPMDLFELYCLLEDAAYSQNLIQSSSDHVDFLRALNASALIYTSIQLFPAAIPDYMAYFIEQHPEISFDELSLLRTSDFDIFFGQHALIEKLNLGSFYFCLNQWIQSGQSGDHLNEFKEHLQSSEFMDKKSIQYQNISKRLIFIFNRLTSLGFLLRSPILKGLGYHPVIHTELPKKFAEHIPQFLAFFNQLPEPSQLKLIEDCIKIQDVLQSTPLISDYQHSM